MANPKNIVGGISSNLPIGQAVSMLLALSDMAAQTIVKEPTGPVKNYPVARGNHSLRPPVKVYLCSECEKPMTKHGSGLGKWHCSSNKSHNHSTYSQTRGPGGGNGKTVTERVRHRNCGTAYAQAAQ